MSACVMPFPFHLFLNVCIRALFKIFLHVAATVFQCAVAYSSAEMASIGKIFSSYGRVTVKYTLKISKLLLLPKLNEPCNYPWTNLSVWSQKWLFAVTTLKVTAHRLITRLWLQKACPQMSKWREMIGQTHSMENVTYRLTWCFFVIKSGGVTILITKWLGWIVVHCMYRLFLFCLSCFACCSVIIMACLFMVFHLHVCFSVWADLCFCASRAMSPDELVYLGVLAVSIPVGFLFRYLSEYFGPLGFSSYWHKLISNMISKMCYLFYYWPVLLVIPQIKHIILTLYMYYGGRLLFIYSFDPPQKAHDHTYSILKCVLWDSGPFPQRRTSCSMKATKRKSA